MKKEINPKETSRAAAFELWMSSPMPMVTLTKTFDVSRIMKISRKRGWKFNMILCWAIGCAASRTRGVSSSGKRIRLILAIDAIRFYRH